jgi:hypothetical protein
MGSRPFELQLEFHRGGEADVSHPRIQGRLSLGAKNPVGTGYVSS